MSLLLEACEAMVTGTRVDCWAKDLGDCEGKTSAEHYISKCLLPTKIEVKGLPWCRDHYASIGVDSAKANVLCVGHNNRLSEVDAEALRFKQALATLFTVETKPRPRAPRKTEKHRVARKKLMAVGHRFIQLNGTLFGRWVCKTYCNLQAVARKKPDPDFVRHAFAMHTNRRLHFYVRAELGRQMRFDPQTVSLLGCETGTQLVFATQHPCTCLLLCDYIEMLPRPISVKEPPDREERDDKEQDRPEAARQE